MLFATSIAFIILAEAIGAQLLTANFTFLSGNPGTTYFTAVYPPTKGEFGTAYSPGGRDSHKIAFHNGLVYSFHGWPYPNNDDWVFDPETRRWAWIAGPSNNATGSYGPIGIALVSNSPGFRIRFAGDYHQARGEFIMYGGGMQVEDIAHLSDLWSFDFTTYFWTLLAGTSALDEAPRYNSRGISNATTTPGAKMSPGGIVHPITGEFLVYGGYHAEAYYGDMFAFNFATSCWTWISGPAGTDAFASLGLMGEFSPFYHPAPRRFAGMVINTQTNDVLIFGGIGTAGYLNDLWIFRRETLVWAWVSGTTAADGPPVYGIKGQGDVSNVPGGRHGTISCYHEKSGLFLVYGGAAVDSNFNADYMSDLWGYNPTSKEWTWIAGSSVIMTPPVFSVGSQLAGAQQFSAITVDQLSGTVYMFGGDGYNPNQGTHDLLWKIELNLPALQPPPLSNANSRSALTNQISSVLTRSNQVTPTFFGKIVSSLGIVAVYFIMAGNGMLLLVLLTCAIILSRRRRKTRDGAVTGKKNVDAQSRGSTDATLMSKVSTTTDYSNSSSLTMVGTEMGLYLPGDSLVLGRQAFRVEKELARGGGGSVWTATAFDAKLCAFGTTIIVKIPNATMTSERDLALFHQEIALLNAFRNQQNIVTLLGYSENPYVTILKFYPRGSLIKWIDSHARSLRQAHAFLMDISRGVALLHVNGIAHCDLKPDNVLIEDGVRLKALLADFGIARILTDKLIKVASYQVQLVKGASIAYASPEALQELRSSAKIHFSPRVTLTRDVYALGMVAGSMLTGKNAWS
eukprot:Partr_v1_DN28337_c0_g1_i1_m79233 putative Inherit from NOG: hedgehog protein